MPTIGCPLSGETADANNAGDTGIEELFIQPVVDSLEYLRNSIPGCENVASPRRTYVDYSSCVPHVMSAAGTEWVLDYQFDGTSYYSKWMASQANANTAPFVVEITSLLPTHGNIVAFGAVFEGSSDRTELPATMPKVCLVRSSIMTIGTESTILETATDDSASIGSFKSIHGILLAGFEDAISPSSIRQRWFLAVFGGTTSELADRVGLLFFDTTE